MSQPTSDDETTDESAIYRAYRVDVCDERMVRSLRTGTWVVVVLNTLFILLDYVVYPERFAALLSVRLIWNVVMLAVYWALPKVDGLVIAHVGCLSAGLGLIAIIGAAGGVTSGYSPGLMLLFLGMPVLVPLSARQAAGIVGLLLVCFACLPLVSGEIFAWQAYVLYSFFPAATAVECVAASALLDDLRFADFKQRAELREARDELRELDLAKSRFTANIHHELRTPLTLILAPLDALRTGEYGDVPQFIERVLRTMHMNGRRLLKLINNLLDLAKLESQQFSVHRQPVDLSKLIEDVVEGARPVAEQMRIQLTTRGLESLPEVNCDPDAIEKVAVNLIGNALKFTEAAGRIEVRAERSDGGVHLEFSDSGVGIPPDQLERVFDRFAQVDGSATRKHPGTGIGLSLAQELVVLHAGRIWAESEGAGRGTSMHVTLPLGEPDGERDEEVIRDAEGRALSARGSLEAAQSGAALERDTPVNLPSVEMRRSLERWQDDESSEDLTSAAGQDHPEGTPEILIADDNPDMRGLMAFLIGREYRVRVTRNGREALAAVRERCPDLVLSDVMMPEMSGTDLCKAIKNDPATRSLPVMLVTSKAEREMKIEGLELGADDYLTKPFHPRELMARVRSLVRVRRLERELAGRNQTLSKALADLEQTQVQLVQAERLAAVGALAAGVAHEINNPVNFAINAARTLHTTVEELIQLVQAGTSTTLGDPEGQGGQGRAGAESVGELGAMASELAGIVSEGLDRTRRIVADLRDFAAPSRGPQQRVDLGNSLRATADLLRHDLMKAGAQLELAVAPDLPEVRGDPGALNQVCLNLIKNAAEALAGRVGSIPGSIRLEASAEGGAVRIRVRDNGPGMPPEVQERLFEPFFTTKEVGQGTGLGLSISKQIIEAHHGSLTVESVLGEGTTFTIELPRDRGEEGD